MSTHQPSPARLRSRWSAIGAAIAIALGAGGISLAQAGAESGDRPVTVTVDAERILDTRIDVGLPGAFVKDTPRDVQVTGSVDVVTDSGTSKKTVVPAGASAVLVNVTVAFPTDQGFLTLRAAGATGAPTTSTVNFQAGSVEPNAATVDLSADGKIQVWVFMPSAAAQADVLIDVVGYTIDHHHDDRYYTMGQVDAAVAPKANAAEVYTQAEVDALVDGADSETITLTGWDFNGAGVDAMRYQGGGCGYNDTGGQLRGSVQVPVGATITGVTASVIDNSASNATLQVFVMNDGSITSIGSLTTSGALPGVRTGFTATITPTMVGPTGAVSMEFGLTTALNLQICTVQVEYDL